MHFGQTKCSQLDNRAFNLPIVAFTLSGDPVALFTPILTTSFTSFFARSYTRCRRLPPLLCHTFPQKLRGMSVPHPRRPDPRIHLDLHHPRIGFVKEVMPYIFVYSYVEGYRTQGYGEVILKNWCFAGQMEAVTCSALSIKRKD